MVDQEVIKSLISLHVNALDDETKEYALKAIEVAVDSGILRCVTTVPAIQCHISLHISHLCRRDDVIFLFEWIASSSQSSILSFQTSKILYKLLNTLNFQMSEYPRSLTVNVMGLSVGTVLQLHRNIQSFPIECREPFAHIIILLRIIGNFLAINSWTANSIITDGFAANNVPIAQFFKDLLETLDTEASQREILWVARNFLENEHLNCDSLAYLQRSGLDMNLLIEYWRQIPNGRN